jgi:hypothetical protein
MGVQMLREPAERTQNEAGDGTTTATLLAHAIFSEGVRNIVAGASAVELKRGIEQASQVAIGAFKQLAKPIRTKKEKGQIATISAHGNAWVGELVRLDYDRARAECDFADTGYLVEGGPLARLQVIELREARSQLFQWAARYEKLVLEGVLSMDASVDEFLRLAR